MSLSLRLGLIYLISEILLAATRRSRSSTGTKHDRGTLRILWLVILVSVVAGIYVAGRWPEATLANEHICASVGLGIFIVGLILRWWAIITLGRFFTVDVTIASDHKLIDHGPFRFVRHPSYTGALLTFAGFALSLGNWVGLLVILLPISVAFVHRMNVEEEALTRALGPQYAAYVRCTKRLVPFVY